MDEIKEIPQVTQDQILRKMLLFPYTGKESWFRDASPEEIDKKFEEVFGGGAKV